MKADIEKKPEAVKRALVKGVQAILPVAKARAPMSKNHRRGGWRGPKHMRDALKAAAVGRKAGIALEGGTKSDAQGPYFYGRIQENGWTAKGGRKIPGKHYASGALEEKKQVVTDTIAESLDKELF